MTRQEKTYKIKLKVKLASTRHGGQELCRFFMFPLLLCPRSVMSAGDLFPPSFMLRGSRAYRNKHANTHGHLPPVAFPHRHADYHNNIQLQSNIQSREEKRVFFKAFRVISRLVAL